MAYGGADAWNRAGSETGLGSDGGFSSSAMESLLHSTLSVFNEGMKKTAFANRSSQIGKVIDVIAGGAFVNVERTNGSTTKRVAVGGDFYSRMQKDIWVEMENDGQGWTVVGIATHAADDSMLPGAP